VVEPDRPQMRVQYSIACWVTEVTDTHSEYVICSAFPWQHWLRECTSVLHFTYIACLVYSAFLQQEASNGFCLYITLNLCFCL